MRLRGRNKVTPEFNMSSMTDIVFLLLIFFMIASTLVSAEAIDLLLPKSSSKTTQTKNVSVSVDKDVNYYVDMKKVSKDNLEAEVLAKVGQSDSPSITIRSDQDVEMKHVVYIMDIANRNKIKSTLAVKSK
ncbi:MULTISPECIES: biopolymer transporter ExbD [Mesoflavibacter]|jgi:biopolymer transport protein ExbD|uniref:Biopolymer transporter ExbD n=1 Tax=Mesoflavibacter zeaxanthinifaciens subsp. sabulilitoris TaxID=1520893 RepID=A0A2T1NBG8_9FLAO|nr:MULTISPECIES: biopolymer transporter ExbD [Mesoflavibacter]MBN2868241.1 biopolymer transporter ExbD [Flavobacteriaceae bacterium]MCP4052858.1 biopolymer transporter ExbD [Mesoflavibacter sp.]MBB3125113.1 biopolymer transport protein ExbD [Mesoflavibacter zeaxanthinifaciens subsp. sabulilitoris]PSG89769.1 biopolymer transporter ExbD [Mesoflavibacter zeaxanthinifaciens subsp. sabulilitoris]UAB75911.1 biopolymer transporter ExbD [Mesoflavibacter sp. SCSIO 43206]|tara:strand:+ start:856 stop:1248 length:393 start_codon:yes stop_codon:yes gene_type:complete